MKYIKFSIMLFFLSIIVLIFSAFGGKGSNSGNGTSLPPCDELVHGTQSLIFNDVDLRYDLSTNSLHESIITELSLYHYEVMSSKGSIRRLQTILEYSENITDEGRRPSCTMTFTSPDCTGSILKGFSPNEIIGNTVHNIPGFGVNIGAINVSIRSYKSTFNNIQLCWEVLVNVNDISNIVIDDDSTVSCDCCWDGYTKSGVGDDGIAARITAQMDGYDVYERLENTGHADIESDGFSFRISVEKPVIPPALGDPVCSIGDDDFIWDEPVILIKDPQ